MKSRNTWGTNFIPQNKSRVQKNKKLASMEQITTTGGTKMLGRRTNKDYMGNIILVQILTTKEGIQVYCPRKKSRLRCKLKFRPQKKLRLHGIEKSSLRNNSRL
jgi:hypothetical protein